MLYSIAIKHSIPPEDIPLFDKHFDSREEVELWMRRNAEARRNLSPEQMSYNRGRIYELRKKGFGSNQYSERVVENQLPSTAEPTGSTRAKVAKELGVSEFTINYDAQFARAVDALAETAGPEIRQSVLSGESGLSKQDVVALAELSEEEQLEAIAEGPEVMAAKAKEVRQKKQQAKPKQGQTLSPGKQCFPITFPGKAMQLSYHIA